MRIADAIVRFGAEAVCLYWEAADLAEDSSMPEIFLGSFIAPRRYKDLHLHARVEQSYVKTAKDLGNPDAIKMAQSWNGNADITIYREGKPCALVELKLYSDGARPSLVSGDQLKVREFATLCNVDAYLGVLVTDDDRGMLSVNRVRTISEELSRQAGVSCEPEALSAPIPSPKGKWHWQMVAWKVPAWVSATAPPP